MTRIRVVVNLPEAMVVELHSWAESHAHTFTRALTEAIALKIFVEEQRAKGCDLLVERHNGEQAKIAFSVTEVPHGGQS